MGMHSSGLRQRGPEQKAVEQREQVIEALLFPRSLVRDHIEIDQCAHAGHYAKDRKDCQQCDYGPECEWLYSNDEFIALERKPLPVLAQALEFALGYVDAQVSLWGHQHTSCHCDACVWLRRTQRLYGEVLAEL